jgi:tetratricopeptide (TPR) repeat protein
MNSAKSRKTARKPTAANSERTSAFTVSDQPAAAKLTAAETEITLHASRRFWMWTLLLLIFVTAGWGNPERVVQRHLNAGQRLTLAKRLDAAIRQYEKVLRMQTSEENRRQAMIALADLHRERREWARAQELYQQLRQKEPHGVLAAWAGLQIADIQLTAGQWDNATQGYTEIVRDYPHSDWDAEAQLGLGNVLVKQEKYAEAIHRYQGLVDEYGGGFLAAEALVHIGECHEALGNLVSARRAYETVLQKYPAPTWDDAKARLKRMDAPKTLEGVRTWGQSQ